jgi:diguanylate cyclase (GGDEF)-like protein/PAS domain S-box-containing protein
VGLGSDARRGAVRALRVSERLFHESMEHSPIGMLISDLNGVWVYTNIALQQMLGYTAAEFRALPPGGPSHPEEWKESEVRWARLLTGELQIYDTVRRFQHKDGHWIWTHVAVSLMRDEEATPLHLIAQIESLVARQLAEATLAEERERLRITLASISDAVVTTDADTRITYLNVAAETLLGLKLATVQTRRVNEVIHLVDPQSSKSAPNLMGQSVLHGQVFRREHPCLLHRPAALIAIDLDRFKALNDAAGHAAGDAMLRRVAETCRAAVRHTDTVARLGGDEFAIVLDNCSEARADIIGNQLLNALNALEIEWLGSRYTNGASLGLAMCTPEMIDQAAWLKCADDACYGAKHLGRGRLLAASRAQW